MKLRMAPNSLFAILLRSSWWISMAIALGVVAVSFALLPENLRMFGAAGAFPFVVLGAIAGWRQFKAPSSRQVESTLAAVRSMGWPEFSRALETAFGRQGYAVERLAGAGGDLLLRRDGRHTVVSARRWKAARHGEDALQALQQAARDRDAAGRVYVALGELSPQALRLATAHRIEVVQADGLAQLLRGVSLSS
jgi:restriction system protein